MNMMFSKASVAAVLCSSMLLAGCSTPPPAHEAVNVLPMNNACKLGDLEVTINGDEAYLATGYASDSPAKLPELGDSVTCIVLPCTVRNTGTTADTLLLSELELTYYSDDEESKKLSTDALYYFQSEDSLGIWSELDSNALVSGYFYIPYEGQGEYAIDLHTASDWSYLDLFAGTGSLDEYAKKYKSFDDAYSDFASRLNDIYHGISSAE